MEGNNKLVVVLVKQAKEALEVINSLGAAEYTVNLAAADTESSELETIKRTRYFRSAVRIENPDSDESIIEALTKCKTKGDVKMVLLPIDDWAWDVLDMNRETLGKMFLVPESQGAGLEESPEQMTKFSHLEIADSLIKKNTKKNLKKEVKTAVKSVVRPLGQRIMGYPQAKKENQRDPNSEKPRAVVAGRNYISNLSIARALGEAGYEVEVLRLFRFKPKKTQVMQRLRPDSTGKYIKAYHKVLVQRKYYRVFNKLMQIADPNRKMLLVSGDDLMAAIVDEYYDSLKGHYIMSNVNDTAGAINHLMKKDVQKDLARKAGLPVVNDCVITTVGGQFEIPDTVTYPCFAKPNVSNESFKSKMSVCHNKEELEEAMLNFSNKNDISVLVEDYLDVKNEYSVLGLSTKEGAIAPGLFVAEKGGEAGHIGVTLLGRMLPVDEHKELIDDIVRFVETLNFEGLFDVDLLETKDGKMYFIELNLRYGGSGYALTRSGINLPAMYADYMVFGKPIDKDCSLGEAGQVFVNERVLIDEYVDSRISKKDIKDCIAEADITFVESDDDPKPYKHFKRFYTVSEFVRIYRSLKGKNKK